MSNHLRGLGWLGLSEQLLGAQRAGEGNMNCTLRVQTSQRTFILKQARPWVEKYPDIPAPLDRALVEARFYALAGTVPFLAEHMPKLIALDEEARLLCLEDLGDAQDFTTIYGTGKIAADDLETLLEFLSALHYGFHDTLSNKDMRKLNHEYIFVQPLRGDNGFDDDYKAAVAALGEMYLSEGDSLLHGDFFPGSWLKTTTGVKVIDPEFCFFGPAEFDLGVMLAHFVMSKNNRITAETLMGLYSGPVDERRVLQFAGVEIMRRILGVAQLPLQLNDAAKRKMLAQSRTLVLGAAGI